MLPVFYLWLDALCSTAIDKHALPYETLKNVLLLAPSLRSSKSVESQSCKTNALADDVHLISGRHLSRKARARRSMTRVS